MTLDDVEPDATLVPAAGRSLLFVIPAYKRERLAAICYRQQADCLHQLRERGLDARALVIADDGNLDAAAIAGHLTIEAPNQLGAKLNAGYRYAREHGFTHVCALGSDSWIDPARFEWLPGPGTLLCTRNYVAVDPAGERQGWFRLGYDGGAGTRVFETGLLAGCGYAPLPDRIQSGCDTETLKMIRRRLTPAYVYTDLHACELVGFQSATQITPFRHLVERYLHEWQEPLQGLADHYPAALVQAAKSFYHLDKE